MNSEKQENINNTVIVCPACKRKFNFNDENVPDGERYEIRCPFCNVTLGRKKGENY